MIIGPAAWATIQKSGVFMKIVITGQVVKISGKEAEAATVKKVASELCRVYRRTNSSLTVEGAEAFFTKNEWTPKMTIRGAYSRIKAGEALKSADRYL